MNGDAPWTPEEEKENNIQVNINFKSGSMLLLQARQQFESAFLTTGNYFTVTVPDAPRSKATKINAILTRKANRVYKDSRAYLHTQREKFGSVALHGLGPIMWPDQYSPFPFHVAIPDILVPTDTLLTLENLSHFAVRRQMTVGQLFKKTIGKGKNVDPGWNLETVKEVLEAKKDENQGSDNWNWYEHPEKLSEIWKQNQTYYDSDATPVIKLWDFYFQEQMEPESCWYRVIMLDDDCTPGASRSSNDPLDFIYKKNEPYADNIDQVVQVQFGDGNNVPPFKWYSVRALGWLLYDVCQMMNRLQCQFTQKVFEDLMLLFRVSDPVDRSRLDKIYMGLNYGIIPDGLNFVKREERYSPDANFVEMLQSNFKQLMGESTSAYTQDVDQGTKKERTAFEVQALLTQTTKLTGSILNLAYEQAKFEYKENCRRLTLRDTCDFTCKRFQSECREAGVEDKWIDASRWEIEPERVLGQGNMQLEQAQAKALMEIRPILNPAAQQKVTNEYVFAITHDAKRTEDLAPRDAAPHVSDSVHDTELVFSAFMNGTAVTPKPGTNPIEVVETMLRLIQGVLKGVQAGGGVGTPAQAHGLDGAAIYTQEYIRQIGEDKSQKEVATKAGKALSKLMNEVRAMHQRQQQAAQAAQRQAQKGNGAGNPEAAQKAQAAAAEHAAKLKYEQALDNQKLKNDQQHFELDQKRRNLETMGEIQRDTMLATAKAHSAARQPKPKASEE